MDFALTEEHKMVAKMYRDFAEKEVAPIIKEWDRKQQMPPHVLPRMAELGLLGVCIPTRYGGQGMDYICLGLGCEELEAVDASLRVVMSVHLALAGMTLFQWGSELQKQTYLPDVARGEVICCAGFTEPGAGSDIASIRTSARRNGDVYLVNGEKMWISLATKAQYALVTVRTNPDAEEPSQGLSTLFIDLKSPGVTTGDIHGKLGVRAGSTGWIAFQDVRVPVENRIGEEGEGFRVTMSAIDNGRYTVAAGAAGLLRACLEASVKYAQERHTFGVPIAQHQLIRAKIARMAQDYDIARLLYLRSGWMKNQGIRNTLQTSYAKQFATDAGFAAASEAIQVFGSYGFSDEYDVERFFRNTRGAMIYEGTSEIHTLIQAGYAFGDRQDAALRCELPAHDPAAWQETR